MFCYLNVQFRGQRVKVIWGCIAHSLSLLSRLPLPLSYDVRYVSETVYITVFLGGEYKTGNLHPLIPRQRRVKFNLKMTVALRSLDAPDDFRLDSTCA